MTHRLAICLAIASLIFMAPRPAAAAITPVFDTVDAVQIDYPSGIAGRTLTVTGIVAGGTAPVTYTFNFPNYSDSQNADLVGRCERFALITMSKPGKYQLAFGPYNTTNSNYTGCKLILRAP
jgi:hypothetical protein